MDLEFLKWKHQKEINIRGLYLTMFVDAEWILSMAIIGIFDKNPEEIKSFFKKSGNRPKGLHELDFFEKIEVCKRGLNKYHQSFYEKYKDDLDELNVLKEDRDRFAHQKMDFYESNPDKVSLSQIVNKLKVEKHQYSISQIEHELIEHNNTVNKVLDILLIFTNLSSQKNLSGK